MATCTLHHLTNVNGKIALQNIPLGTGSKQGHSFTFWMRCSLDINMGQGGKIDSGKSKWESLPLSSYSCQKNNSDCGGNKFTYFLGQHNLAISVADDATNMFSLMFPDSAVATYLFQVWSY